MHNEISDSLKAKLYDYSHTPFFSSFIISWIVLNHKYLMVYFSDMKDINKKLGLLNEYGNNSITNVTYYDPILPVFNIIEIGSHFFWYPLIVAIFYVYGYPYIAHKFYNHTRNMNNKKKSIKLECDGKEPIDDSEKRIILLDNYELKNNIEDLKLELSEQEKKYEKKCENRIKSEIIINNEILQKEHDEEINLELSEKKQLFKEAEAQIIKLNEDIKSREDSVLELKLNNKKLTDDFNELNSGINKLNNTKTTAENEYKVLRHETDKVIKEYETSQDELKELRQQNQNYEQVLSKSGILMSTNEVAKEYNLTMFEVDLLKILNDSNYNVRDNNQFINEYLMGKCGLKFIQAKAMYGKLVSNGIIKATHIGNNRYEVKLTTKMEEAILRMF